MAILTPKLAFVLCLGILLTGCQTYSLVNATQVNIGNNVSITPDIQWNKRTLDNSEVWTVDGEGLQALHLYKGLGDGDVLFPKLNASTDENVPKYRGTMSLLEIREFIEASIVQQGFTNIETTSFRPEKFGGRDGFRVEFTFSSKAGLRNKRFATGAKVDDKLYLVIYRGTKLHYYDRYLKNVEDMLQTIQLAWARYFFV